MNAEHGESVSQEAATACVRRVVVEDLPAILDISNWATTNTAANLKTEPETLEHWVDSWKNAGERFPWFVAEVERAVIGFAMASAFHNRCGYANTVEVTVYVAPTHFGKGVGSSLYNELIPTLHAQGYKTLVAVIALPNPASERLHARFNFRRMGVLERVGWKLGEWRDVAYWQLVLNVADSGPTPIKSVGEIRNNDASS